MKSMRLLNYINYLSEYFVCSLTRTKTRLSRFYDNRSNKCQIRMFSCLYESIFSAKAFLILTKFPADIYEIRNMIIQF